MKRYNAQKIDLPTHRQQLRRNLLNNHEKLTKKLQKPIIFHNWKTVLAGTFIVILVAVGSLKLPFLNNNSTQKVNAKTVIEKAKENYFEKAQQKNEQIELPEYYNDIQVWDYFPEDEIIITEDFDEYGFFEVLDNYNEDYFEAELIEQDESNEFYEVEFIESNRKIQLLIDSYDYAIVEINIFEEDLDTENNFIKKFSQQWQ